jgi:hypothetical protein
MFRLNLDALARDHVLAHLMLSPSSPHLNCPPIVTTNTSEYGANRFRCEGQEESSKREGNPTAGSTAKADKCSKARIRTLTQEAFKSNLREEHIHPRPLTKCAYAQAQETEAKPSLKPHPQQPTSQTRQTPRTYVLQPSSTQSSNAN